MVALVGVLLLGILKGVILAAVVSLAMLLRDMARPHVAILGRIPGRAAIPTSSATRTTKRYRGAGHPGRSPLLYFNANHVRDTVGSTSAPRRYRSGSSCSTSPPLPTWT